MNQLKVRSTAKSQITRQKIIDAAFELFYLQGYQSTTMDQVIEASGVSKPTVYIYFPSKEILCVEYLKERHQREAASLSDAINQADTPRQRYMSVIYWLRERLITSNYRGCGFFNMIAEIPTRTIRLPLKPSVLSMIFVKKSGHW